MDVAAARRRERRYLTMLRTTVVRGISPMQEALQAQITRFQHSYELRKHAVLPCVIIVAAKVEKKPRSTAPRNGLRSFEKRPSIPDFCSTRSHNPYTPLWVILNPNSSLVLPGSPSKCPRASEAAFHSLPPPGFSVDFSRV